MGKYHDIEEKSGIFQYQDGDVPVEIHSMSGQARIKHLAWYIIEEVSESLSASTTEQKEEVSDALHFLVEMFIICGYHSRFFGPLEDLWKKAELQVRGNKSEQVKDAIYRLVYSLGNAMNLLKNKPWKQTHKPVNLPEFEYLLRPILIDFLSLAIAMCIESPKELYDLYMGKAQINTDRQNTGY